MWWVASMAGLALLTSGSAFADESLGILTFDGPTGPSEHYEVVLQSIFIPIFPHDPKSGPTVAAPDASESRDITVTARAMQPQPALLAWVTGAERKRHAVIKLQDRTAPVGYSVYDMENVTASSMSLGYTQGSGQQTLVLTVEHLKINGQAIY